MSEIKVNKISPKTACGTVQLGDSGDTITIPAGATITNNGTQTGFGRSGSVNWQTSIKTANFTAVSGEGYFCNTTGGVFTVTLPASPSAGAIVAIKDYANTFDTNNLTIARNSSNIGGAAEDSTLSNEGIAVTLVYADATKGWLVTESGLQTEAPGSLFVAASGGCITTSGDYKIHTFNAPGTFTVTCSGNSAGSNVVDYLVVAGGGGGGNTNAAGGGAGGYRESVPSPAAWTSSPIANSAGGLQVIATSFPIVVGGGGTAGSPSPTAGGAGSDSSFSTITSAGGGGGCNSKPGARDGGSGAGGPHGVVGGPPAIPTVGSGNTPPVSPSQGFPGGTGIDNKAGPSGSKRGGSGGGATAIGGSQSGTNTVNPAAERAGGAGATSCISGSPVARGGGGGSGAEFSPGTGSFAVAAGGVGGGGSGAKDPGGTQATAGTVNTGGGGGGGGDLSPTEGKAGGSGVVILRYKYQ